MVDDGSSALSSLLNLSILTYRKFNIIMAYTFELKDVSVYAQYIYNMVVSCFIVLQKKWSVCEYNAIPPKGKCVNIGYIYTFCNDAIYYRIQRQDRLNHFDPAI